MNNIVLTDMDVILFTTYNYNDGFFRDGNCYEVLIDNEIVRVYESAQYPGVFAIYVSEKPMAANVYIPRLYRIVQELVPSVNRTTLVIHDKDLCETFSQSDEIKVRDEYGSENIKVLTFKHTSSDINLLLDNNPDTIEELQMSGTVQNFIDKIVQYNNQHL